MTVGQLILAVALIAIVVGVARRLSRPDLNATPWTAHRALRWMLGLWAIAYPIVSCAPLFVGASNSAGAGTAGGLAGIVLVAALFLPWIVGVIVLGVLVWVTD